MKSLKQYAANELSQFKKEISVPVYILWWVLRILMAGSIIKKIAAGENDFSLVVIPLNLLATFTIPVFRFVFFKKIFIGRLPFVLQNYIDIIIFFGSFVGQAVDVYEMFPQYDKFLHLLSGAVVALLIKELIPLLNDGKKCPPLVTAVTCAGMSSFVMVAWEIFEFFSDYYINDSYNQAYNMTPTAYSFFFKIFGKGCEKPELGPVFDTNLDLIFAALGCFIASVVIMAVMSKRKNQHSGE